jgi:uncharacterized repeat protein (TIGR04076 family)
MPRRLRQTQCSSAFMLLIARCRIPQHARTMSNAESKDSREGRERSPFFELYDLKVEVIVPPGAQVLCGARPGDWFELRGEMLYLPPGQGFSIYSLAALLLLLPAKQRILDPYDWMYSDSDVACPDPNCPSTFRITRLGKRRFERSATTATPIPTIPK